MDKEVMTKEETQHSMSCKSPEQIFQEKFNKDFPSFMVVHKSECIELRSYELNGRFLSESAIAQRCIDKRYARKIIDELISTYEKIPIHEGADYITALNKVKKKLGVDKNE